MLTIVDTGIANVGSIKYKLYNHGIESKIANSASDLSSASKIILPGVGHFKEGMKRLNENHFTEILRDKVLTQKTPILAICLGMQLLTHRSEEGDCMGLGLVDAETVRFQFDSDKIKIPHVGWNGISLKQESKILKNINHKHLFYFTHSYYVKCNDKSIILSTTNYGVDFVSSIKKENIYGTQFHPEKSHETGFQIITNFINKI